MTEHADRLTDHARLVHENRTIVFT